ncbi:MAG: sigma-70 family RNA polymerase sigma factor [Chlorobi bacterium]|nr:sigma-70 family RNA polymerase sigma factor [Chlorobiota bacterium]
MVLKRKNTDQDIIEGIMNNDSKTISLIYRNDFDRIKSMVKGFGNISLQPEDVFQEGLTRAIINVRNRIFKGDSSFSTYLYGICRNLCLKDYNRQRPFTGKEMKDIKEETGDDYFEELQMIIKVKDRLDEQCRKIIDLRFGLLPTVENSTRFDAIARFLGINADNARQRFRRCFSRLKAMVLEYAKLI